jgi:hypothetical protein
MQKHDRAGARNTIGILTGLTKYLNDHRVRQDSQRLERYQADYDQNGRKGREKSRNN